MADLIDRQAAIDAIKGLLDSMLETDTIGFYEIENVLFEVPSAQPEVLACGEGELSAQPEQTDCEYCHEDSDGYVIPLEKNSHAFIRFGIDGWELSLKAKGWHGSAKIRYCPMCGRRLERG